MINHILRFLSLLLFLLLAVMSYKAHADNSVPQKVRLNLVWKHQFQFAGYYMAKEKGFYSALNLDVEFNEPDSSISNLDMVKTGAAEFAVGRSSLLVERAQGAKIVALLAAFQRSPFMIMTKAFTGLDKPEDLRGRRVMITPDTANSGELLAMLTRAGLSSSDYIRQPHSYNVDDLISGHTDAMSSYVSNEPYKMIQQGIPYTIMHPADYGFKMYSDILYTSEKLLSEKPKLVEKFYEASIKGWKYAFANIPETVSIIFEKYNSQNRTKDALNFEAQELKKLAFDRNNNFGTLSLGRFQAMAQIYLLTGAIQQAPNLEGFIYRPPAGRLNLTYAELDYVKNKQSITVCVQKDWNPYETMKGNQYQGIIADFTYLLRDKTGLSINIFPTESSQQAQTLTLQGICDITPMIIHQGDQHANDLLVSDTFLNITQSFLSTNKTAQISDLTEKIAMSTRSNCSTCVSQVFPEAEILAVNSALEGIDLLEAGKVSSVLAAQVHLRYLLTRNEITQMHIIDDHNMYSNVGFGMNTQRSVLLNILNKTISLISARDRDQILSKWYINAPPQKAEEKIWWLFATVLAVLFLFLLYRYNTERLRSKLLKELSETDQLTGISNRRKMIQVLQEHIDRANRYHNQLSLIFLDIDDFKIINDRYGHKTGDRILKEISSIIRKHIRKTDTFARWGGEEFIIASPETSVQNAEKQANILLHGIYMHDFNLDRQISCSFGVTQYLKDETLDNFVNRADQSMYKAKKEGKNRVDITQTAMDF